MKVLELGKVKKLVQADELVSLGDLVMSESKELSKPFKFVNGISQLEGVFLAKSITMCTPKTT